MLIDPGLYHSQFWPSGMWPSNIWPKFGSAVVAAVEVFSDIKQFTMDTARRVFKMDTYRRLFNRDDEIRKWIAW